MTRYTRKYSNNLVYILRTYDKYYVGCRTLRSHRLSERDILKGSGNKYSVEVRRKKRDLEDYLNNTEILEVIEFDNAEDALNKEIELIAEYRERYKEDCINRCNGNKTHMSGYKFTEEQRKEYSERIRKTWEDEDKTVIRKEKMRQAKLGKPNCCNGTHWYNNGTINKRSKECPEGFVKGKLPNITTNYNNK